MRTSNNQTEGSRRVERFSADRHYIKCQIPDAHWDGGGSAVPTTPEQFLSIWDDQTGEAAYRPEFDGGTVEGRAVTNSSRIAILSCSKEYADRMRAQDERDSRAQMVRPAGKLQMTIGQEIPEQVSPTNPVSLTTAFQKADTARKAQEALLNTPD